jgi:K+:H+ antiporter
MRSPSLARTGLAYGAMILFAVAAFFVIRSHGEKLIAPAAAAAGSSAAAGPHSDALLRVLLALAAVIALGQILARLFSYLGQPPVIGEVVGGILLGPSILGPELSALVLPPSIAPTLGVVAQLGVLLYMFLVGLRLDLGSVRARAHATVAISHASIVAPFLLGAWLALALYPRLSSRDVPFTSFALFMGVAMSVTAFPVLARILTDLRLARTELGAIALSCAAADDVTAWCLLAMVVGVAQAQVGQGVVVAAFTLVYILVMFLVGRPLLKVVAARWETGDAGRSGSERSGGNGGPVALVFLAPLARAFTRHLEQVVTVLLLPAYFAFTGMRTRIDLMSEGSQWLVCGLIILVAIAGKFGGTLIASRLTGLSWRQGSVLGVLMNTRGLMELIVLNVGLDLKVISPELFAMMVVMAIATTLLTAPVLRLLEPETAPVEART